MEIIFEPALLVGEDFVGFVDGSKLGGLYWNSLVVSYCLFLSGWCFLAIYRKAFLIVF